MNYPSSRDNNNQEYKDLPQCKIKRNYSCTHCLYFTQNPRFYLTHLRDVHGERITLNNCNLCLYASRHYQKLVRHMKMVHGTTAEAIPGQTSRKRPLIEEVVTDSIVIPPLPTPPKWIIDIDNLSYDLKSSRKTLRDIAAIYFAENDIEEIMAKMEASDVVEVVPEVSKVSGSMGMSVETVFGDPKSIGSEDLDIICECGYVSTCFLDSIIHGKSCLMHQNVKDYECTPLDLSLRSLNGNPTNGIQMEPQVAKQVNSKKSFLEQFEYFSNCEDIDLTIERVESSKEVIWNPEIDINGTDKTENQDETPIIAKEEVPTPNTHKKVFKCPLCSFWASTASRFHVHIVGHQNKKSFKCSLCAYCSNWRWDITKHIRLRTLRSPSHRNARVLIHGEIDGGRHNYEKYDRYITLVKISEQDDDLKFKRCGELVENKEDSEDLSKDDLETQNCSLEKVQIPTVISSLPEVVQNETNSQSKIKECSPRTYLIFEDGEKPFYKCSQCYFSHPNRDAVLVHIKFQHHDLLTSLMISSKSGKTNAGKVQGSKELPNDEVKSSTGSSNSSKNITDSTFIDVENDDIPKSEKHVSTDFTSSPKDSLECVDIKVEDGQKTVDGGVSSSNNDEFDARTLAAFRCWHCHQVSNWKHVIQRHCRLKHSGSIRIESIHRSPDTKSPIYRMLNLSSNSSASEAVSENGAQLETKTNDQKYNDIKNKSINSDKENEKLPKNSKNKTPLKITEKVEHNLLKFACIHCPFIGKNEFGLNRHCAIKHKASSSIPKTPEKSIEKEEVIKSTAISEVKKEILDENDITYPPEKCLFCSFESGCPSAMKFHTQTHIKISKVEEVNIKKEVESNINQSEESSSKNTNHLEIFQKLENSSSTHNTTPLKTNSALNCDKQPQLNSKLNKISNVKPSNYKMPSTPPAASPNKTIFVNPKTGKIVRRN
ncbi:uncharacterized protein LOC129907206 [Episyrphus balteatus]|uniref:uncharacterized protein LOC129907206 n=1 Tax=Episyrphus balteatus TaxID=286459 RepID=UPI00248674F1|nr:uncharacterized protein LOC129907206 [Episyrphus balteatus]